MPYARAGLLLLASFALAMPAVEALAQTETSLVSVNNAGAQGNRASSEAALSGDGRLVVFSSEATNLAGADSNGARDVFVRDRGRRTTTLLSRARGGGSGNGASIDPAVSLDGRVVVFQSAASNLVGGDGNSRSDIFLRAVQGDVTRLISIGGGGLMANGDSLQPAVSESGRYIAFVSRASNLIAGDTNSAFDIFVRDRDVGRTSRVSVGPNGRQANGSSLDALISGSGRVVAFSSEATNLVTRDPNGLQDVFLHNRDTRTTRLVSVGVNGAAANGKSFPLSVSRNGRYVLFTSMASNLVAGDGNGQADVFLRDQVTARTQLISVTPQGASGNGVSDGGALSADGLYAAFRSRATNLVAGDTNGSTDIFIRQLSTGRTARISVATDGTQAKPGCFDVALSLDAETAAFSCDATNLVAGDLNLATDIFIREPLPSGRRAPPGS